MKNRQLRDHEYITNQRRHGKTNPLVTDWCILSFYYRFLYSANDFVNVRF